MSEGRGQVPDSTSPGRLRLSVAVVGRFTPWFWGQPPDESYLADALEQLGVRVFRVDQERPGTPDAPLDWALFTGDPGSYRHLDQWNGRCKTALWTLDWIPEFEKRRRAIDAIRLATLFVSSDRFDWKGTYGIGHHAYLPGACEAMEVRFDPSPRRTCAFLGTIYNERRMRISSLVRYLGGEVVAQGDGWKYRSALVRFVQETKVVIGDNFRNDVDGYWSSRNYVIPGAGGFLLTPRVPGLEEQFGLGKHIAVYDGDEQLGKALRYWIEHDCEREAIRRAGFEHVRRHHTWTSRAFTLTELLWARTPLNCDP